MVKDPAWKSGPVEQSPTSSNHRIHPSGDCMDIDGLGRDEADRLDGTGLFTVQERYECSREGCDAFLKKRHVYALEDVPERVLRVVVYAIDYTDEPTDEDVIEYLATHAEVRDYLDVPVVSFQVGGRFFGEVTPRETITDEPSGSCFGRAEPPSHEPYGL